jgi:hypothetical protein
MVLLASIAAITAVYGLSLFDELRAASRQTSCAAAALTESATSASEALWSEATDDPGDSTISLARSHRDGIERVEGSMSLAFAANEAQKSLHVPLWPPLATEPSVECELEGLDGRVRVALAKRHGFRIDVRLPEAPDEPLHGTLRFVATASCASAAA